MPPRYLRTADDVDAAIQLGTTTEGLHLEFKETINGFGAPSTDVLRRTRKELCRDITQFANHQGGCLLIGVAEYTNASNLKVAARFAPVSEPDKLREWIEQAITDYCVPNTFTRYIEIIPHSRGTLLAVNVPPSRAPVVLWDRQDHTMQAVARNNHGKHYLNPDELERLRMNGSRAAKIAFDEATQSKASGEIFLSPGYLQWNETNGYWIIEQKALFTFTDVTNSTFRLSANTGSKQGYPVITIPYGLIRECWRDTQGRPTLLLHLDIGLHTNGNLMFVDAHQPRGPRRAEPA